MQQRVAVVAEIVAERAPGRYQTGQRCDRDFADWQIDSSIPFELVKTLKPREEIDQQGPVGPVEGPRLCTQLSSSFHQQTVVFYAGPLPIATING